LLLGAGERRLEGILLAHPRQAAVLPQLIEVHGVQDEATDPERLG
jgi:hypothetical protein